MVKLSQEVSGIRIRGIQLSGFVHYIGTALYWDSTKLRQIWSCRNIVRKRTILRQMNNQVFGHRIIIR